MEGRMARRTEENSSSAARLNVFLSLIKILKKESSKYPHSTPRTGDETGRGGTATGRCCVPCFLFSTLDLCKFLQQHLTVCFSLLLSV